MPKNPLVDFDLNNTPVVRLTNEETAIKCTKSVHVHDWCYANRHRFKRRPVF